MKKLLYLLLILPLLVACGSDDDDDKTEVVKTTGFTKDDVVGTWKSTKASFTNNEEFVFTDYETSFEFKNDNTSSITNKKHTIVGTYVVSDNNITVTDNDSIYILKIVKKIGVNTIHMILPNIVSFKDQKYLLEKQ